MNNLNSLGLVIFYGNLPNRMAFQQIPVLCGCFGIQFLLNVISTPVTNIPDFDHPRVELDELQHIKVCCIAMQVFQYLNMRRESWIFSFRPRVIRELIITTRGLEFSRSERTVFPDTSYGICGLKNHRAIARKLFSGSDSANTSPNDPNLRC